MATLINDDSVTTGLHWSSRYSLMEGVQSETLLLVGAGAITPYEAFVSVLKDTHLWSVVRSTLVVQNIAVKSNTSFLNF